MELLKYLRKLVPISITDEDEHRTYKIFGIKIKKRNYHPHKMYLKMYRDYPIDNHKILFKTFKGMYNCNPKYIAEEILRQNLPYELIWVVDENILKYYHDFPKNIKLVMRGSKEDYHAHLTAKFWITHKRENYYIHKGLKKREGQIYIQTWHGSLGIKKTGEVSHSAKKKFTNLCKQDAAQYDYLISNGTYTTNFFKECFWNNGQIMEFGHPRNDIFFRDNTELKRKIQERLNISADKKIVMYAPTFRDDYNTDCYGIDFEKVLSEINSAGKGEYVFVLKLHPKLMNLRDEIISKYENCEIIDATDYGDMQELLAISDILITDYSSCAYDFMLTGRPVFIFATDIKEYNTLRGLYYPLTTTPFPIAENNSQLVENIKKFDNEKYLKGVEEFLKGKGCIDDGHASERVVELIKKLTAESEN